MALPPRLVAAEAHGSLTVAWAGDDDNLPDIEKNFETLAVSIGATRSTYQALTALRQSGGLAVPVGNSDLITFQEQLALTEGIFAELASVTRSEEHTSELQSLMRSSDADFCVKITIMLKTN